MNATLECHAACLPPRPSQRPSAQPTSLARLSGYVLPLILSACTPAGDHAQQRGQPSQVTPPAAPGGAAIPGIPARPDLVAVVPFARVKGYEHSGLVLLEAAVDGHRGIFQLDTGAPIFGLNSAFLQHTPSGRIDTVTGGAPPTPARTQPPGPDDIPVTVHTLGVGTLTVPIDSVPVGASLPQKSNALLSSFDNPTLGTLGLTSIEPFETIVDYVHQRVVFIRLDRAGRRLVEVPAYPRAGSVQLVPVTPPAVGWWAIRGRRGAVEDSVGVDVGTSGGEDAVDLDQQQAADQLKQAIAADPNAGRAPTTVSLEHGKQKSMFDHAPIPFIFCYPFLRRLGVVGFNLRAHELILYH